MHVCVAVEWGRGHSAVWVGGLVGLYLYLAIHSCKHIWYMNIHQELSRKKVYSWYVSLYCVQYALCYRLIHLSETRDIEGLREQSKAFVEVIWKLLERLLVYRNIIQDEIREHRMSCIVNLLVHISASCFVKSCKIFCAFI